MGRQQIHCMQECLLCNRGKRIALKLLILGGGMSLSNHGIAMVLMLLQSRMTRALSGQLRSERIFWTSHAMISTETFCWRRACQKKRSEAHSRIKVSIGQ